ncbi:MAG: nucleoside triphosphate pyrophosphohydrolase [Syntrophobacterales bacterium]|nr:nucleoside triphosphate pyrophosphohydrolase [Syntrophobacterales bacterium]
MREPEPASDITDLLCLIRTLRGPEGCPWDRVQTEKELGRYLLSEAYEVLDAIGSGSPVELREELGDLLFQILFLVVLGEERGSFTLEDVIREISAKMIRRHPHVFGDAEVRDAGEVKVNWERIKATQENKVSKDSPLFAGISRSLPALARAQAVTERAATVGFDWEKTEEVLAKVDEELVELRDAIARRQREGVEEELGDLLFSLVNLSRFLGVQAEEALRGTTAKFLKRFRYVEERLQGTGNSLETASLAEMDRLWEEAKQFC